MSVSLGIYAFRPPDEEWTKMKAVWDACAGADVEVPDAVLAFFDHEEPDPAGVDISLDGRLTPWRDDYNHGYELAVGDIPPGVQTLRFVLER